MCFMYFQLNLLKAFNILSLISLNTLLEIFRERNISLVRKPSKIYLPSTYTDYLGDIRLGTRGFS